MNIEQLIPKANSLFESEEYAEVLDLFIQIYDSKKENPNDEKFPSFLDILNNICTSCLETDEFDNTEKYFVELYDLTMSEYGKETLNTATASFNLGNYYYYTQNYEKARECFTQTYELRIKLLGEEDDDTLNSAEWLGVLLTLIDKWEESKEIYFNILKIQRKTLQKGDSSLFTTILNLAKNYNELKEYSKSKELYIELYDYKKEYPDDEELPTLEVILNKICTSCLVTDEFENTEKYFVELYDFVISEYGKEHFETTTAITKLAQYYYKTGNYEKARGYFAQSYELRIKLLGKEDNYTLSSADWLGATLTYIEEWSESAKIHEDIIQIQRKILKPDNPKLLSYKKRLAVIYFNLDEFTKVEDLYLEIIPKYEKLDGLNSSGVLKMKFLFVRAYENNKKYPQVVSFLKQMLSDYSEEYNDDETTAKIMDKLADNLSYIPNKNKEAELYYKKVIEIYEKEIGLNEFKTIRAYYDLAYSCAVYSDDFPEAKRAFEVVINRAKNNLDIDSWIIISSLTELGGVYSKGFNDNEKAKKYLQDAKKIISKSTKNYDDKLIRLNYFLAHVLIAENKLKKAKELLKETIKSSKLIYGIDHNATSFLIHLLLKADPKDSESRKIGLEYRNRDKSSVNLNNYASNAFKTKSGTKKVRVFISSTFRDMMPEREYLMKNIFPKLRKLCRNNGYDFTEIDLRWGITEEDAKKGKVIEICLNEIDKSRPFFIGMIGERYGWVPEYEQTLNFKKMLKNFDWLEKDVQDGLSVTEMEVQYGVLRNPAMLGNAFFYLRDKDITPEGENFYEIEGSKEHKKLIALKDKLRKQEAFPYKDYSSIEFLGDSIFNNLKQAIFGDKTTESKLSDIDNARDKQINFVKSYTDFYIPEEKTYGKLNKFISGKNFPFKSASNKLVIFGKKGCGKTALLTSYVKSYFNNDKKEFLFFHFAEADLDNKSNTEIVKRIINEINIFSQTDIDVKQVQEQNPASALEAIFSNVKKQIIIVIDGIEKIQTHEFFSDLFWLPKNISSNVKFIISTNDENIFNSLKTDGYKSIEIGNLSINQRQLFVNKYLNKFGKKLPENIVNKIVKDEISETPLSLKLLLDELRIFGVFEELNEFVGNYLSANNEIELFTKLFERMEADYEEEHHGLVGKALSFIALSKHGLTEGEIINFTESAPLYWSPIYNSLENYLHRNLGQLSIKNEDFYEAVKRKYLTDEEKIKDMHKKMLDYFQKIDNKERTFDELSYHLHELKKTEDLKSHLSDIKVFMLYYNKNANKIIKYWNKLKQKYDIIETYKNAINNYEQKAGVNLLEVAQAAHKVGSFIGNIIISKSEETIFFPQKAYEITKKMYGAKHLETASVQSKLISLYLSFDIKKAEKNALEVLDIFEQNNVQSMKLISLLSSLSQIYIDKEEFDKAEKYIFMEQKYLNKIWGGLSLASFNSVYKLGEISYKKGEFDKAIEYYNETVTIIERFGGKNNMMMSPILNSLSEVYMEKGMFDKALETVNESIATCIISQGKNSISVITSNLIKVTILFNQGKNVEALKIAKENSNKCNSLLGAEHELTQTYLKLMKRIDNEIA